MVIVKYLLLLLSLHVGLMHAGWTNLDEGICRVLIPILNIYYAGSKNLTKMQWRDIKSKGRNNIPWWCWQDKEAAEKYGVCVKEAFEKRSAVLLEEKGSKYSKSHEQIKKFSVLMAFLKTIELSESDFIPKYYEK